MELYSNSTSKGIVDASYQDGQNQDFGPNTYSPTNRGSAAENATPENQDGSKILYDTKTGAGGYTSHPEQPTDPAKPTETVLFQFNYNIIIIIIILWGLSKTRR